MTPLFIILTLVFFFSLIYVTVDNSDLLEFDGDDDSSLGRVSYYTVMMLISAGVAYLLAYYAPIIIVIAAITTAIMAVAYLLGEGAVGIFALLFKKD
jgi:hypothetical protein